MPNVDESLHEVSQILAAKTTGTLYFTVLDLKKAYYQLKSTAETAKQCIFNSLGGQATGAHDFLQGSIG